MGLAALLPLAGFFVVLFLATAVYGKNPKAQLNRGFAGFAAVLCYYLFTQSMLRHSETYQTAYFWAQAHKPSLAFMAPAFLNLILIYTRRLDQTKRRLWVYGAIYLPAFLASFVLVFTQLATTGPVKYPWGYEYGVAIDPAIFLLLTAWALGLTAIGGAFLIENLLAAEPGRTREQAGYMLIGIFIPSAASTTILLFPALSISSPFLIPVFLAVSFAIIAWTITKYELFEVSPEKAVDKIITTMTDSLFVVDDRKNISFANRAAVKLLGYQESELLEKPFCEVIADKDLLAQFGRAGFDDAMIVADYEAAFRTKQNEVVRTLFSSAFIPDNAGKTVGIVAVVKDVTEWVMAQERIEYLMYHDFGTDLPNISLLRNLFKHAMGFADRTEKKLALVVIRLGQLKRIKSAYGHDLAEGLVREIADRLAIVLRRGDVIGRAGSDELGIVLGNIDEVEDVVKVTKKVQEILAKSFAMKEKDLRLTANIGISIYPDDAEDLDSLFRNADSATNQAELLGANSHQFFTHELNIKMNERLELETDLAAGIDRDEIVVFYQPHIDIATGRIVGMEALARWLHPKKGMIGPVDFISIAEESDLIIKIDKNVLHQACKQAGAWQKKGFGPLVLSVNMSARDLYADEIVQYIAQSTRLTSPTITALEIELTETTIMDNLPVAAAVLENLKAHGVKIAIDDFGTGYSSLSILRNIPLDTLKIDRSFVMEVETNKDASVITETIISMARAMKLKVIAEGVETKAQAAFLRALGCHIVQGFYYSPPLPADQFELLLRKDYLAEPEAA